MAEGILKSKNIDIIVDSAGTSNYHINEAPDTRMQKKALEHGINISNQKGRQFSEDDFENFDYIFAMDSSNKKDILKLAKNKHHKEKVNLFLNYAYPNQNLSVPDPYYGGEQGFEDVYQMLDLACEEFIKKLKNE